MALLITDVVAMYLEETEVVAAYLGEELVYSVFDVTTEDALFDSSEPLE